MRELLLAHEEFLDKLIQMEAVLTKHDENIILIFEYLKQLEQAK